MPYTDQEKRRLDELDAEMNRIQEEMRTRIDSERKIKYGWCD
jgi:hypothetical protein